MRGAAHTIIYYMCVAPLPDIYANIRLRLENVCPPTVEAFCKDVHDERTVLQD